jgi:MOSC domain-containing protein YiiM
MALVVAIFLSPHAGAAMRRVAEVCAVAGKGLNGDRYAEGAGYYSRADPCEVTLVEGEALERMADRFRVRVSAGEHRRNLVTRGVALSDLRGRRFTIGDVLLEYDRPRPPCGYLERLTEPGMTRAMGEGPGIAACIIRGGTIREGDRIEVIPGVCKPLRRLP